MSALGERSLMLLLTDTPSVESMVKHGLNVKIVPTVAFREVVSWSLDYYQQSSVAPTPDVLRERFGADLFTDNGLDLDDDVEEAIDWAIDDLEGTWIQQQTGLFTRKLATEISSAPPEERVERLGQLSAELASMVLDLQPRVTHVDIRESGPDLLAQYEVAATTEGVRGMTIGVPVIDNHLGGIWDGELVTFAGPPGSGKSFLGTYAAHHEWDRGRNTVLFTLENSIEMTQMRIACCALNLDATLMQSGSLPPADVDRLWTWCNDVLRASDTPLHIISPEMVNRSPQALVAAARAYEAESLIVDQLTHITAVEAGSNDKRNQEVATIVRTLGNLISTGRHRLPCLLLHQVNREGVKAAETTGRLRMNHMAESSEIERTSSVVLSLYQTVDQARVGRMGVQMLKQRRIQPRDWELTWAPWQGIIAPASDPSFEGVTDSSGAQAVVA